MQVIEFFKLVDESKLWIYERLAGRFSFGFSFDTSTFFADANPLFEDPKEALLREQLSREVWSSHPNRVFIESGSIEKKIRTAAEAVDRILKS